MATDQRGGGGRHPSANSGRRRTQKLSDLRQHFNHIEGFGNEEKHQLGSVPFENRDMGFHRHIRQQQVNRPRMKLDYTQNLVPIVSFKHMEAVTPQAIHKRAV
jgi:hypothetical protein